MLLTVPTNFAIANEYVVSKSDKKVAYWLLGMCGLVAGMVTVGGITRLTRSGLSMTDWKLQGSLPPLTPEQWGIEFERYKQYPEWQQRKSLHLRPSRTSQTVSHRCLSQFARTSDPFHQMEKLMEVVVRLRSTKKR